VGDVVVKFDWQRPFGAACNLMEDVSSGWRKDYKAIKFWGNKASLFSDARIAVVSDLSASSSPSPNPNPDPNPYPNSNPNPSPNPNPKWAILGAGVYNTEVTLAEQCGDLMQNVWENMVVDYELPSYNHTYKKKIVVRLG